MRAIGRPAYILLALLAGVLTGCGDDEKQDQRAQQERAAAERAAKRKSDAETEARLLADPVQLSDLLERRIKEWLTVTNGLLIVREGGGTRGFSLHSMPLATSWMLRCDGGELELSLGPWTEGSAMFTKTLTAARLSEDQCTTLIVAAGEKMLAITRSK